MLGDVESGFCYPECRTVTAENAKDFRFLVMDHHDGLISLAEGRIICKSHFSPHIFFMKISYFGSWFYSM
jgi:hypothetical protein